VIDSTHIRSMYLDILTGYRALGEDECEVDMNIISYAVWIIDA
jgi:hypothetical protein